MSFREDLNQRSKRNRVANGIPMLDELFTSSNANGTNGDQPFLALVSKLQARDFASPPKSAPEPTNTEIINTWELMAGLEEQAEQNLASSKILDFDKMKRSKSYELSSLSSLVTELDGLNEDQFNLENKGVGRSRSFHTVQEYDTMIQRIMLSGGHNDDYDSAYKIQTQNSQYLEHNVPDIHEIVQSSFSRDKYLIEENTVPLTSEPDIKEVLPSNTSCNKFEDVNQERRLCDIGLKRKAMAKGLESLQIPSTVEFRTIGSLRDWLHNGGRVNSPGEYVTPKFGNYNKPEWGEKCKEDSMFNPELVAAFEEFMQQLEVEEESVLKQIEGNSDEIMAKDMPKEEILSKLQG